ncbi:hypothetical protein EON79_03870 [bacterium]|nr:MAG: hypothetical protein EON79_03870 [bacterium]
MTLLLLSLALTSASLKADFATPPDSARPWVYWYFMEGQMSRPGLTADLEAMKKAGIGGGIFLEVDLGLPKGPVKYMTPEWRQMVGYAAKEADRLGLAIALGTGPGWCGAGGPWVKPEDSMQHLVSSGTDVTGPSRFNGELPQPKPRTPFFGMGSLSPELQKEWETFYRDEFVLAVPTQSGAGVSDLDEKALVYRAPFSSAPGVKQNLVEENRNDRGVDKSQVIDLTSKLKDGRLKWEVPEGKWTILRFGRTLTGTTTRPAPAAGLGFETDKFETEGIERHLDTFVDAILKETGPRHPGRGITTLHFDSWEMGAQNWSANFRAAFQRRRGYDPLPYLPVMAGKNVGSTLVSERFLWDLRQTAQEVVADNQIGPIKARSRKHGLNFSIEPYDMNPAADMRLGSTADIPMGEFWSKGYGFDSEYAVYEAVSIGHTNGRPVIGAEAFTSDSGDAWLQHPATMKAQGDWALAAGINKFVYHRYQHQPELDKYPGLTMGPYGVHWERTSTWWDLVGDYHRYIARCQQMLRQGQPVADILYLAPEGAPNVFLPSGDATIGRLPDRRGYGFDGCDPETLIIRAKAKDGQIVFPDGTAYRLLAMPRRETMTPRLLKKVAALVEGGVTIVGMPPKRSPSLVDYPECDTEVAALATKLWTSPRVVRDASPAEEPISLEAARWIWSKEDGVDPQTAAPVGQRTFRFSFKADGVASARAAFTADNVFRLSLNGTPILSGTNFNNLQTAEVGRWLRPGDNELVVTVENEGTAPNPAGLLGVLELKHTDGRRTVLPTDGSWKVDGGEVGELGPWTMGPWGISAGSLPRPELYPSYSTLAEVLRTKLATAPDLESGEALRYGHRRIDGLDAYFVANRSEEVFEGPATFRVAGARAEWWDPMTGRTRPLPNFTANGKTTTIPMRLDGLQSGFVVFHPDAKARSTSVENFPRLQPVATLDGSWKVGFETRFGGPASADFPTLKDWKDNADDAIRHYSGKAVYTQTFDSAVASDRPTTLSLGEVRNIAHVTLNGRDLGTAWCAPWQVEIPAGVLRAQGNRLEITVANLWSNRLIGDAGKPQSERITSTSWSPYGANSPLQSSGLLGPVRILQ